MGFSSYYTRAYGGARETNAAIRARNAARISAPSRRVVRAPSAPTKPSLSAEAKTAWEQAIAQYGPEGGYGKGVEAGLERGQVKATTSGMQSLVSAGLAGTTMAAGLGKKYEEEVAAPARARVESTRAQAISGLRAGMAGAIQRGYETSEDRALRERLAASQQNLSYAQMESSARLSAGSLASQEAMARMRTESREYGAGGGGATPAGGATQHAGQVPSPFARTGGGYSPPMKGWGGGIMAPQPGLASQYT